MLKNLQRLICEDRAVASQHAEVLQSPNSPEISREKAEGGDPTRLLLEISYQAGEKAAVRSLAWSTGKWEAGLPCPTSNCLRLSLFPSQNVGVIVQAEHEALKPRSG